MKKQLFIDISAVIKDANQEDYKKVSFHQNTITVISKIAHQLGYAPVLVSAEPSVIGGYIQDIFSSESVTLSLMNTNEVIRSHSSIHITSDSNDGSTSDRVIILDTVSNTWTDIFKTLSTQSRKVSHSRVTKETQISIVLDLDGQGKADISTGLHFFDHMLEQIARHGNIDLSIHANGDLHIDEHHTIEDTAITLGEAFALAIGDKRGIERYGFCLPMDDALAQVAVDFGGRSWIVWNATFRREKIGDVPTEMFFHFFKSFSDSARCNLSIEVTGENEHHKIEAIFKAFAKAIKMALRRDPDNLQLPSTKGLL